MEPLIHLEGMKYPDVREKKCGWCFALLLLVSTIVMVLSIWYLWQHAVVVAALLPGIVDHQPRERRLFGPERRTMWEWFDAHKNAVAGYFILAFVVLFAAGVFK